MQQMLKLTLIIALFTPLLSMADIAVIVHIDNPIDTLSTADIKSIYKVRRLRFPDSSAIVLSYQPDNLGITQQFFQRVIGRPMSQHSRFWATRVFSGRMLRPVKLMNDRLVIEWVSQNKGGIGYVDDANLTDTIKKIATIEY